jgi:D-alanyl-D-alanine carboxypeptidase
MNRTARVLGMAATAFSNPTGLTHCRHASCAWDVAALASACQGHAAFRAIAGTKKFKRSPAVFAAAAPAAAGGGGGGAAPPAAAAGRRAAPAPPVRKGNWENVNQCLGDERSVRGAVICGVKTGITPGAGACLVLVAAPVGSGVVTPVGAQAAPAAGSSGSAGSPPFQQDPLFLSVVLGSDSGAKRFIDSTRLLTYGAAALDHALQ